MIGIHYPSEEDLKGEEVPNPHLGTCCLSQSSSAGLALVAACRGGFGKQRIMITFRASGYCAKTICNCQDSQLQRKQHSLISC